MGAERMLENLKNYNGIKYAWSKMGFYYAGDYDDTCAIANHVVTGSIPEEFCVYIVKNLLSGVQIFIDVGANTGLYCFVAAKHGKPGIKIYAYEPQVDCVKSLNETIKINDWEGVIDVFGMALSNSRGEKKLFLSGTGTTLNNDFNDNADLPIIMTKVDTLDNQILDRSIKKVGFIKIDVEGCEQAVLDGAENTIKRDRPILFIEIADRLEGRKYQNHTYAHTLDWIRDKEYLLFKCDDKKMSIQYMDKNYPQEHIHMYLCLPVETSKVALFALKAKILSFKCFVLIGKIFRRIRKMRAKRL